MNIKELKSKKVGFVSFGCGKNVVELEKIISNIKNFGFDITTDQTDANILIVNSCAFLKSTRQESFDIIKEFLPLKSGNLEKIVLTGCLSGYNLENITQQLMGVDLVLPQSKNGEIVKEIAKLYGLDLNCEYDGISRILTTPSHYAYLRIADGCDNFCSYCTIPFITGRYKSVPMELLIKEAQDLANKGVKELILVAQDITIYGTDLYKTSKLVELIKSIAKIDKIKKIRLIYCYPENITDELIYEIKTEPKVCKYIDIPLQHISNNVLKLMNRKNTKEKTINLITKLKNEIPNIQIRSTFILGFPNETEDDFKELCEFVKEYKLNQLGFFAYSREKGTIAYKLKPQIDNRTKQKRINELAKIQFENVKQNNEKLIGQTFEAVVDEINKDYSVLRTDFQLPELDNVCISYSTDLQVGKYYNIKIVGYKDYDLIAEVLN